jgi:hypothetical protein
MGRVRRFLALSANEQLLLVVSGFLFAVFSITLRVGTLRANEAFARWLKEVGLCRWSLETVQWALSVVESNRPGSGGCLPAAMVGLAITDELLELRFGVRDDKASIEAHAWLECAEGQLLYVGLKPSEFRRLDEE